ncbi:MAG: hypothetical protein IJ652_02015 [Bacteroidales bacterium]|nr:hypothetical protein [Bacteroidales bacterium]
MSWLRRCCCLAVCLFAFFPAGWAQDWQALQDKLDEYLDAMASLTLDEKMAEVDVILESCHDRTVRDKVAVQVYQYFMHSKVMGDEAVAIHLTDKWFATGEASLPTEIDLLNAQVFADFNRRSLLGMQAPPLTLFTPEGAAEDALPRDGRRKILLFHDTDCATCKVEHVRLVALLGGGQYAVDVVSVYTGDDAAKWAAYREKAAQMAGDGVRLFHYWDPEVSSEYQMKYGVLQTPRIFLIDRDGTILGRGLDADALRQLLDTVKDVPAVYGGPESQELFERLFAGYTPLRYADIRETADYIRQRTLDAGQTRMYKQLTGDLLYYLSGEPGEACHQGLAYVADSLVLDRPDIWNTPDDTLKVVGLARVMSDLLGRAAVGSRVPAIRVPAVRVRPCGRRSGRWRLDRLRRPACVIFYSEKCGGCEAELAAVKPSREQDFLLVDLDAIEAADPALFQRLLDSFDLTALPHLVALDASGIVERKYFSLK